jgi:hypothetical protein
MTPGVEDIHNSIKPAEKVPWYKQKPTLMKMNQHTEIHPEVLKDLNNKNSLPQTA